jgi:fatty acid synthase, animal type
MNLPAVYPKVDFPVSRGTPMISSLIKWNHTEEWFVTNFASHMMEKTAERKVRISFNDAEFEFMSGHCIDGEYSEIKIFRDPKIIFLNEFLP